MRFLSDRQGSQAQLIFSSKSFHVADSKFFMLHTVNPFMLHALYPFHVSDSKFHAAYSKSFHVPYSKSFHVAKRGFWPGGTQQAALYHGGSKPVFDLDEKGRVSVAFGVDHDLD